MTDETKRYPGKLCPHNRDIQTDECWECETARPKDGAGKLGTYGTLTMIASDFVPGNMITFSDGACYIASVDSATTLTLRPPTLWERIRNWFRNLTTPQAKP